MDGGTNSWAKGLDAITLFVEDLEATRRFYTAVFGLPVEYEDTDSLVLRLGGTLVNLLVASQAPAAIEPARLAPPEAGVRTLLTIGVDDVDLTAAEVVSRGAVLLSGPLDRPWGIRTAAFADPSGHLWELAGPMAATESAAS